MILIDIIMAVFARRQVIKTLGDEMHKIEETAICLLVLKHTLEEIMADKNCNLMKDDIEKDIKEIQELIHLNEDRYNRASQMHSAWRSKDVDRARMLSEPYEYAFKRFYDETQSGMKPIIDHLVSIYGAKEDGERKIITLASSCGAPE